MDYGLYSRLFLIKQHIKNIFQFNMLIFSVFDNKNEIWRGFRLVCTSIENGITFLYNFESIVLYYLVIESFGTY
jgi:hypothetical protein